MGKRAVMYGAGNIGRGFIGMLFAESGYTVTFVDIAKPLVDAFNKRCGYTVRILDANAHEDVWVSGVDAMQNLLIRFANRSLADTCARVGADIPRKLSASDRLIGASRLCLEQGVTPAYICAGAAGAIT